MKKLLILTLVLSLVSSANATLTLGSSAGDTLPVAGTTTLSINSDTASPYGAYMVLEQNGLGAYVGDMQALAAAGADASVEDEEAAYGAAYAGWWYGEALSYNPDAPIIAGTHFEIGFECLGIGDITVTLLDFDEETVLDTMVIHQIPEPASMLLLGLGGLFLRRRK